MLPRSKRKGERGGRRRQGRQIKTVYLVYDGIVWRLLCCWAIQPATADSSASTRLSSASLSLHNFSKISFTALLTSCSSGTMSSSLAFHSPSIRPSRSRWSPAPRRPWGS
eukprot:14357390-Heterocapsa_arctica.AAC.1